MLSTFLAALYAWADNLARFGLRLSVGALESGAELAFTPPVAAAWLGKISLATLALVAPFLAAAVLAAVVANVVQTGAIFSAFPLKPDFQRLNPALGFKRLFSLKVLVETGKTILKLVLFAGVAYLALSAVLPKLLATMDMEPKVYFGVLISHVASLIFKLLLVFILIVLVDLAYSRWDYARQMMMSRRELKDEIEADVLITNPEHFAVALAYDRMRMRAPTVIAKGAGDLALELRSRAARAGIPTVEDKPLARRLFIEADIDRPISEDLFEPVARVYAGIYASAHRAPARLEVST